MCYASAVLRNCAITLDSMLSLDIFPEAQEPRYINDSHTV